MTRLRVTYMELSEPPPAPTARAGFKIYNEVEEESGPL
jgi:hypothetical protein